MENMVSSSRRCSNMFICYENWHFIENYYTTWKIGKCRHKLKDNRKCTKCNNQKKFICPCLKCNRINGQVLKRNKIYFPTDIIQQIFEYTLPITKRNFVCVNKYFNKNDISSQDIFPVGNSFEIRFQHLKNMYYLLNSNKIHTFEEKKIFIEILSYHQTLPTIKQSSNLVSEIDNLKNKVSRINVNNNN